MKKIICLFFALILAFALSISSFAATVPVDEFKLIFNLPDEWHIVTKNSTEDEQVFEDFLYYEPVMEYIEDAKLSIYALTENAHDEFTVQLEYHTDYYSFDELSSSDLEELCEYTETNWGSYGYNNCKAEIYDGLSDTFIKVKYNYPEDEITVYGVDYLGYIDNVYCIFSFYSYGDPISSSETDTITDIINNVESDNYISEVPGISSRDIKRTFNLLKGLGAAAVAGIGGFFAWMKRKKSKNNTETTSQTEEIYISEPEAPSDCQNITCSECGATLSENDKFCPLCGNKVK